MIRATLLTGIWQKGQDFMDESPRYTLFVAGTVEGTGHFCDCLTSAARWHCVVWTEREAEYRGFPKVTRYYGVAEDCTKEALVEVGPLKCAKDCRLAVEAAIVQMLANA